MSDYEKPPIAGGKESYQEYRERIAQELLKGIEGVDDSQELNVYETSHNSGYSQKHKITAGEFRKQIQGSLSDTEDQRLLVNFDDGGGVSFTYHDFYDIEVVTPEIKAAEEKEEKELKEIDDLAKLGVDSDVFYVGDFDEMGNDARKRKFNPEKIVEFGKIIEKYLKERDGK